MKTYNIDGKSNLTFLEAKNHRDTIYENGGALNTIRKDARDIDRENFIRDYIEDVLSHEDLHTLDADTMGRMNIFGASEIHAR